MCHLSGLQGSWTCSSDTSRSIKRTRSINKFVCTKWEAQHNRENHDFSLNFYTWLCKNPPLPVSTNRVHHVPPPGGAGDKFLIWCYYCYILHSVVLIGRKEQNKIPKCVRFVCTLCYIGTELYRKEQKSGEMTEKHAISNPFESKSCSVRKMRENKSLFQYLLHQSVDWSGIGVGLCSPAG